MVKNKTAPSEIISGDLLVIIAMAMFGSYGLFLNLFPQIPTLLFLFSFQIVGCVMLFLYLKIKHISFTKSLNVKILSLFVLLALVAVGNDLFYFFSYRLTSIANAVLTHQLVSFFLLFLSPLLTGEKTRKNEIFSFLVAISGMVVIFWQGLALNHPNDIKGIELGVLSALCYALLIICYRIIGRHHLPITVVNFWRYALSTIIVLPFIAFGVLSNFQTSFILPILCFGIAFAVIASNIHNLGMMKARTLHVSIIGKSEPVFAILYGMVFLRQIPSVQVFIGGLLIVASGIYLTISERGKV